MAQLGDRRILGVLAKSLAVTLLLFLVVAALFAPMAAEATSFTLSLIHI